MKYFEREALNLKELMERLDALSKYSAEDLARRDSRTNIFSTSTELFQLIIDTVDDAKSMKLNPTGQGVQHANDAAAAMIQLFDRVLKMNKKEIDEVGPQLMQEIVGKWRSELYPYLVSLRPYGLNKTALQKSADEVKNESERVNLIVNQLDARKVEIDTWYAEAGPKYQAHLNKLESEIQRIMDLIAELGVSTYERRFLHEAREHRREAKSWLTGIKWCAFLFLLASGLVLYVEALHPASRDGVVSFFASTTSRLVILSLPSIGLLLCMRNYAASRHNYIVNKHRQNALATFNLFRAAAPDDDTRKTVLTQSMQAIFSPQSSGYLKTASDNQSSTQFIELINKTVKEVTPSSN